MYTYQHPRPALTVDCVVFGLDDECLTVLLIERRAEPFAGCWALPGGFVEIDEDLENAARRELAEETGLRISHLEQLHTFGRPDRDPRERVVSVAYLTLVRRLEHPLAAASDARQAAWVPVARLPRLAFDHEEILAAAHERLRDKLRYRPLGFELLPNKFTMPQLVRVYEMILARHLDQSDFRKKMLSDGVLQELDEFAAGVSGPAARLYRFDKKA